MILIGSKPVEVHFVVGDITIQKVDAIVNAANPYLKHGGGVAGIIVRKGGSQIQKESDEYVKKYGPVKPGNVAVTTAGLLDTKYIIHAVGPTGDLPENDQIMESCFENILKKSDELGLKSIAIPFVGTGIFEYPLERFVQVAKKFINKYFHEYSGSVEKVIFCDIDSRKIQTLEKQFQEKR
ncbi:MAG: macro domain-containing protein [Fervidobacterium sp.]|nr:macro domain-containing protein [Fervidobacterium sp.]